MTGHCENCGASGTVVRHHDDYRKPDETRWLCHSCHRRWHWANGPGQGRTIVCRTIRGSAELDRKLEGIAERENRSTHKQIIHFLEQAVERDETKAAA